MFNRQRWTRYLWVLGLVVLAAVAGVFRLHAERERQAGPPPKGTFGKDAKTTAARPPRPLGKDLMVDKNGTIWRGEEPVGVWGVDGGEPAVVRRALEARPSNQVGPEPRSGLGKW